MPGNNATNLFFFFENSICTIVYLILMLFFVCLSSRNTCAPLRTHTHTCVFVYTFCDAIASDNTNDSECIAKKKRCHGNRTWFEFIQFMQFCMVYTIFYIQFLLLSFCYVWFFSHIIIILCLAKKNFKTTYAERESERGGEWCKCIWHPQQRSKTMKMERAREREQENGRVKKKGKRKITLKNALLNVIEFM